MLSVQANIGSYAGRCDVAVAISVRRSRLFVWLHHRHCPTSLPRSAAWRTVHSPATYAANPDRWAILPGEYDGMCVPTPHPVTLALAHPGANAVIPCAADGAAVVHLGGAWRGRLLFEGSGDGGVWQPVALLPLNGTAPTAEATQPGIWRTPPQQSPRFLRLRVCDLSIGTVAASVTSLAAVAERRAAALDCAA